VIALGLLVALFFPFIFRIDFEVDKRGINTQLFLFKKQLYRYKKTFGKEPCEDLLSEGKSSDVAEKKDDKDDDGESAKPQYVPPVKTATPAKEETFEEEAKAPAVEKETVAAPKLETPKAEPEKTEVEEMESDKKRSLTDEEFWTLLLTPEFDARAWWSVKHWLSALFKLFRIQFKNCYVEGIALEYQDMGYAAAINAFLKAYPYIGCWDFRMDWTYSHELRAEGHVYASVNLCRVCGLFLSTVAYGGVVAFSFWRRRARILKTNELPELGIVRKKIVKMMSEDD
jgi:hypothetical protein